jgi:hypothetical protein
MFSKDPKQNKVYRNLASKLEGQITYDFNQFGEDDQALEKANPEACCLKICNKIGYYMQVLHEIDILRMTVEFYQDETGCVQLYHASDIWIRCLEGNSELKKNDD